MSDGRVGKVAIVGGGSAGFLAALALRCKLPALEVAQIAGEGFRFAPAERWKLA